MGERRDADHEEAWERFMAAEREDLEKRRNGLLRRLLDGPLPGESPEELEQLASEDEAKAEEGLVELKSPGGEAYHKHIDVLSPEDRTDLAAAEGARVAWLAVRTRIRAIH
jgi:hypothetical protein